jgi:hypothetical protein
LGEPEGLLVEITYPREGRAIRLKNLELYFTASANQNISEWKYSVNGNANTSVYNNLSLLNQLVNVVSGTNTLIVCGINENGISCDKAVFSVKRDCWDDVPDEDCDDDCDEDCDNDCDEDCDNDCDETRILEPSYPLVVSAETTKQNNTSNPIVLNEKLSSKTETMFLWMIVGAVIALLLLLIILVLLLK